jgi:hypothetical protein
MNTFEALAAACARPVGAEGRARRRGLAALLESWPGDSGDDAEQAARADLAEGGAPLLTSGQQAGLAGGVALTLWKALALVAAADRVEAAGGRRPLCLFWVEGNDHDWEEAARPGWPSTQAAPCPADQLGASVGRIDLPATWWREREPELAPLLADWPPAGQAALRATLTGSLARHTALLLHSLLPGSGLLVLDPSLPGLRRLAAPFVERLQQHERAVIDALRRDTAALLAAGHPAPVQVDERPPWFTEDGVGHRRRAEPGEAVPAERFSPNALTRILLQDWLLQPAASFLGPGEQAYHAQVAGASSLLGLDKALRLPRPRLQLSRLGDAAAWRALGADPWVPPQAGGVWPLDLLQRLPGGGELDERLRRLAAAQAELLALGASGRGDQEQLRRRLEALGAQLRQSLIEAHKAAHRGALRDLHQRGAWQDGAAGPQERRINTLALVGRMGGAAILPDLRRRLDPFAAGQQRFRCDPATGTVLVEAGDGPCFPGGG